MAIERVESHVVKAEALEMLGLDASLDVMSREGLAASLRRAASFMCPTSRGALTRAVVEVLSGLPGFGEEMEGEIEDLVEGLLSYGDLLELPLDDAGRNRRHIFLGAPAWVARGPSSALLIGVRPEGAPLVSDELVPAVEYKDHARFIRTKDSRHIRELLDPEGLIELHPNQWANAPRRVSPEEVVTFYANRLQAAGPSGEIDGVRVLDPASRVTYYKGRWRVLKARDGGRFVARRPQAFGADLWCFAEVVGGAVVKLIDLPLQSPLALGADEAWRLQAALDSIATRPQQVRIRTGSSSPIIDFLSPVPSWMRRRLDVVGTPLHGASGALFSYLVPPNELGEEVRYLKEMMWLTAS
jgi:hypothetical protein